MQQPPWDVNRYIAQQLYDLRERRRYSQPELAARCAAAGAPWLGRQQISACELSRLPDARRPRRILPDELVIFERVLEVPLEDLFPRKSERGGVWVDRESIANVTREMQRFVDGLPWLP